MRSSVHYWRNSTAEEQHIRRYSSHEHYSIRFRNSDGHYHKALTKDMRTYSASNGRDARKENRHETDKQSQKTTDGS